MSLRCSLWTAVLLSALGGCAADELQGPTVPEPVEVPNQEVADTDATYFSDALVMASGDVRAESAAALKELVEAGIALEIAWFPTQPTACMAPGACTVSIIRLRAADDRMAVLGYLPRLETASLPNCGVSTLLEYRFGELPN